MGDVLITIDYEVLAIASGILTVAGGLLGWIARNYFKRMDRERDELNQRMVRDKDELNQRMIRDRAELVALIKQSDKKGEKRHRETRGDLQKLDRKIEKRHRETLNTLINLTLQGGRHEGPGRVKDDSAARLGQHSPRRNDEPSSTRDVEADPERDALRNDMAMVPVAGIGTEPAHGPSLAHQAAPGQQQPPQRADKAGTEPDADESAETAP